jgi:general stress protein 26
VVDLTPYAEAVNGALASGHPCILATVDPDGRPNLGFKGSMLVFDREHLAYWERTFGRHLANVRARPHVAVLYFDYDKRMYVRFYGEAEVHERGPVRDQIMARVVQPELDRDPERKGFGVLIRVTEISEPFKQMAQASATR